MNSREEHPAAAAWWWGIAIALVVVTVAAYWPVRNFEFVTLDDVEYVTQKPWVQLGLTWDGLARAWTEPVAANWHPLTMITHMLDCQLFGVDAGWHHLTNLALHVVCSVLLFWVLWRMTGQLWPAAIVSALFAWHPLRVESVAWISERKDVLSGTLAMCVLAAYLVYVRDLRLRRYALVFGLLALGLLAKPMLVTLPFVMLLLDYWPLNRLRGWDRTWREALDRYGWLALEKVPLIVLVLLSSVITFLVQRDQGAVEGVTKFPLSGRIANAIATYVGYIGMMIWPSDLAVPYPLTGMQATGAQVAGAAFLLVAVTIVAWCVRRRCPWILVGWLWYLGMLVPVIGIVQVGRQAMADRYTYLPSIGLSIAVVWTLAYLVNRRRWLAIPLGVLIVAALVAYTLMTHQQVEYWRNSAALYAHALDVTQENATAHLGMANELVRQNEWTAAIEHYRRGLEIEPESINGYYNLAVVLLAKRVAFEDVERNLRLALERGYNPAAVHARLGELYLIQGNQDAARNSFANALKATGPQLPETVTGMAVILVREGEPAQAVDLLSRALQGGFNLQVADKLAWIYATHPDEDVRNAPVALQLASEVCRRTENTNPAYLDTLAAALAANGQFDAAVAAGTSALRQIRELQRSSESQHWSDLSRQLERRLATYGRERPFTDDPQQLKY